MNTVDIVSKPVFFLPSSSSAIDSSSIVFRIVIFFQYELIVSLDSELDYRLKDLIDVDFV